MSTQAVREYLQHIWTQYQLANKKQKSVLLNELCRNLNLHRKAAIRLMNSPYKPRSYQGFRGGKKAKYSKSAKFHLARLWREIGYPGAVKMKAALAIWLPYDEHKDCDEGVRAELLAMSVSTIFRILSKPRAELKRKQNTGTRKGLRKYITKVPIRNLGEKPKELGHAEVDTVAHCGGSLSGEFAWSLTLTDIKSGWTECEAIWAKTGQEVRAALKRIERRLPFSLKALYFDNGSEFMNKPVIEWFAVTDRKIPLPLYRGRPYKKNDQAYVEQKNYTHIRQLFGYGRIDWKPAVKLMNNIYRKEWRALQNFFIPQMQLCWKEREGSKVKRRFSEPETPYERLKRELKDPKQLRQLEKEWASYHPFKLRKSQILKTRYALGYFKDSINKSEWGKMAL